MRTLICPALPWLALALALGGMRTWDPAFPISLLILLFLFWAINWLVHHISLRWLRYLRYLFWLLVIGAIVVVPELRAVFKDVISLESGTLITLSIVTLIAWGVMCLSQPVQQSNS